ncbi:hypothetical protein E2C01_014366 [Portunus trituberculatus]|uniref:Uncharacterized protein n=1 Tax=Portunus trituberculatus TaxID=210409 RepID=A0A5B7DIL4_PORTR|nr:hypothetical protein [Portunus trituberculatus]
MGGDSESLSEYGAGKCAWGTSASDLYWPDPGNEACGVTRVEVPNHFTLVKVTSKKHELTSLLMRWIPSRA